MKSKKGECQNLEDKIQIRLTDVIHSFKAYESKQFLGLFILDFS
jgi:hypothetical protein